MRAITVQPRVPNSTRLEDIAEPPVANDLLGRAHARRSASAAPIARSSPATTARRRRADERLVLGHESLGEVIERRAAAASLPAISSSASCGGPIRCPARPAPPANGTCAATAATPSAASRSRDGFGAERFRTRAGIRRQGRSAARPRSACCSSRRASSPRRGITSSASAGARARGSRRTCWSPAPGRSACWRR